MNTENSLPIHSAFFNSDRSEATSSDQSRDQIPLESHPIHQRALKAAKAHQRAEAELLDAIAEVESSKIYLKLGYSSIFRYCVEGLRLSEATAYIAIGVSRKVREIPELGDEIKRGELTLFKAKKIVSVITPENHSSWIEKAKNLSSRKLEKEVAAIQPSAMTPERARYVSEGRLALNLGLNETTMLKFRRAQDQVSQSRSRPVSLEETLEELLSFYLKHKDPVEKARRVIAKKGSSGPMDADSAKRVKVKLPAASVKLDEVTSEKVKMERVKLEEVKKRPLKGAGLPNQRIPIPAAILHQVRIRDQGRCQYRRNGESTAICGGRRWIEIHHILPVSRGGRNTVENLITLCRGHHRLNHEGDGTGRVRKGLS